MLTPDDRDRLARYAAGDGDEAWRAATAAWIAADDERRALAADLARIQSVSPAELPQWDEGAQWTRLAASLGIARDAEPAPVAAGRRRSRPVIVDAEPHASWWRVASAIAAAVVIAAGALGVWRSGWPEWLTAAQAVREVASAAGNRTTITLLDGTMVVLGPASRLRVPVDYGRDTRTVELDGQALLKVVHDARHPFAVRTAREIVRDIGTTFMVRAYRDDLTDRVVVAEGEVAVSDVRLSAGEGASVDAAGHITVERAIDAAAALAWTQGELAFKDTPLSDVVRELGRFYDVDVRVEDAALAAKPVTGTFRGQTVDDVLREIVFAVGGRYERSGRSVVIRRGAGAAGQAGQHGAQERTARERVTR